MGDLSTKQAARELGVSDDTVLRRCHMGLIDWYNAGPPGAKKPRIRITPAALRAYKRRMAHTPDKKVSK